MITKKVKIVVREHDNMCFPINGDNNDKYLESALKWSKSNIIYEVDNDNFSITIEDSADKSSQGGKLSFWTCSLTHPEIDKTLHVGISSDYLINIIKSYNILKGNVCDDNNNNVKFKFNFKIKSYCPVTENICDLNYAKFKKINDANDEYDKLKSESKKTTKYNIGQVYFNSYVKLIYLGKYDRIVQNENKPVHLFIKYNENDFNTLSASEIIYNGLAEYMHIYETKTPLYTSGQHFPNTITDDIILNIFEKLVNNVFDEFIKSAKYRYTYSFSNCKYLYNRLKSNYYNIFSDETKKNIKILFDR